MITAKLACGSWHFHPPYPPKNFHLNPFEVRLEIPSLVTLREFSQAKKSLPPFIFQYKCTEILIG